MTSSTKEQTYFLSKLLNQGGCLSCLNKRCLIKEQHGIPFPDKFCNYIKYPTNVSDIKNSIEKENIDLEGKTPIYTICNYINKVCKNCEEGRYKRIKLNNKNFVICFSLTKKDKITFGIHIDLKLVLKGTQFDVIAMPYDMKIKKSEISIKEAMNLLLDKEKSFVKPNVQIELETLSNENTYSNTEKSITDCGNSNENLESKSKYVVSSEVSSVVSSEMPSKMSSITVNSDSQFSVENIDDSIKDKDNKLRFSVDSSLYLKENSKKKDINLDTSLFPKENSIISNEEEFPALSPSSLQTKVISPKIIDYSQINKSLKNDIIEKEIFEKKQSEYFEKIKAEKESKIKITQMESYLNKKNHELELKIIQLEDEIKKNSFKYQTYIKNKDIYDEIFFNKNKINTLVYDTFYSTNYEDYLIL